MDENDYLQKITELIYDDNKIVTSTTLSKILKLKVCDIQNLLDKYIKNADVPDQTDLSWTFIVIGTNLDNGVSILVSNQEDLDEKKSKLKNVISEHVYSIQRKGNIDLIALANVEPFTENDVRTEPLQGTVVSKNVVKRKLKNNLATTNRAEQNESKRENKQTGLLENTSNKGKKNGIESFCSNGAASNVEPKPVTSAKSKQKNMMANFFSKSSSKTENTHENLDKQQSTDTTENITTSTKDNRTEHNAMEIDSEPLKIHDEINDSEVKIDVKVKGDVKQKPKKSKKRKSENKSSQASKRRKRIIETGDSDSDIFASSESEIEVIPDIIYSDDEDIKSQPQPTLPVRARRMKQVTEEFMDEDGYMNTVQKYIFVSDDEDEDKEQKPINTVTEKVAPSNKDISPAPVKKEISPKKMIKSNKGKVAKTVQNQPSIMSFFKKT